MFMLFYLKKREKKSDLVKCPLCHSDELILLTDRKNMPILQNVSFNSEKEARSIPKESIKLSYCKKCSFAFNSIHKKIKYSNEYENNQSYSQCFFEYKYHLAQKISSFINQLQGKILIVEIACGQGDFIKNVLEGLLPDIDYTVFAFDPAYRGEANQQGIVHFVSDYYSSEYFEGADFDEIVIIARHVIAQIPDPHIFIENLWKQKWVKMHLFLETPDFNWILEHCKFEDIIYEYCSYFTPFSLQRLLKKYEWEKYRVDKVFNDQYLWLEATASRIRTNIFLREYLKKEKELLKNWKKHLEKAFVEKKKIFLWGAGAKGVAFANLLDPEKKNIYGVVDVNPNKAGKYLSGSGHRIVAPNECVKLRPATIIVMNINYLSEIQIYIEKNIEKSQRPEILCM